MQYVPTVVQEHADHEEAAVVAGYYAQVARTQHEYDQGRRNTLRQITIAGIAFAVLVGVAVALSFISERPMGWVISVLISVGLVSAIFALRKYLILRMEGKPEAIRPMQFAKAYWRLFLLPRPLQSALIWDTQQPLSASFTLPTLDLIQIQKGLESYAAHHSTSETGDVDTGTAIVEDGLIEQTDQLLAFIDMARDLSKQLTPIQTYPHAFINQQTAIRQSVSYLWPQACPVSPTFPIVAMSVPEPQPVAIEQVQKIADAVTAFARLPLGVAPDNVEATLDGIQQQFIAVQQKIEQRQTRRSSMDTTEDLIPASGVPMSSIPPVGEAIAALFHQVTENLSNEIAPKLSEVKIKYEQQVRANMDMTDESISEIEQRLQTKRDKIDTQLRENQQKGKAVEQQLKTTKQTQQETADQLQSRQKEIEEEISKHGTITETKNEIQVQIAQTEREIKQLQAEVTNLQEEYTRGRIGHETVEAKRKHLTELSETLIEAQKESADLITQEKQQQEKVAQLQAAHNVEMFKKTLIQCEETIAALQNEEQSLKQAESAYQEELKRVEDEEKEEKKQVDEEKTQRLQESNQHQQAEIDLIAHHVHRFVEAEKTLRHHFAAVHSNSTSAAHPMLMSADNAVLTFQQKGLVTLTGQVENAITKLKNMTVAVKSDLESYTWTWNEEFAEPTQLYIPLWLCKAPEESQWTLFVAGYMTSVPVAYAASQSTPQESLFAYQPEPTLKNYLAPLLTDSWITYQPNAQIDLAVPGKHAALMPQLDTFVDSGLLNAALVHQIKNIISWK